MQEAFNLQDGAAPQLCNCEACVAFRESWEFMIEWETFNTNEK
jgi:hypothetical protein